MNKLTNQRIGWKTAFAIVVSNMIGTGVFTSLGFQLATVQNTWSIILLWLIGGVLALIGALTFAELGTHFRESGGDYIYLSRIFHPIVGYVYAWISLTVGFSAPVAIAAMAMVSYMGWTGAAAWIGVGVIVALTAIHSFSINQSGGFHNIMTALKIIFVIVLIILGLSYAPFESNALNFDQSWQDEWLLPGFAVSLIYVTYAYTGWNSAAYITDEIDAPKVNLPKALIGGTLLVTVVYILLQFVFLKHAGVSQLEGQVEVATISFANIFGQSGSRWVAVFIAVQLVATISGYLWVGSRIVYAMANEHSLWKPLAIKNKNGIPVCALWALAVISVLLTLTGSFEQILLYSSFVLQLMGTLTVASLIFVQRKDDTFKSPFRPFLQIVYIIFSTWAIFYVLMERPYESLIGLGIVAIGVVTYFFND